MGKRFQLNGRRKLRTMDLRNGAAVDNSFKMSVSLAEFIEGIKRAAAKVRRNS